MTELDEGVTGLDGASDLDEGPVEDGVVLDVEIDDGDTLVLRPGRMGSRDARVLAVLFVLSGLVGAGSCLPWYRWQVNTGTLPRDGIEHWRGAGWAPLVLACITCVAIYVAAAGVGRVARAVLATLFGSMLCVCAAFVTSTFAGAGLLSPAWGILLALACSVAGTFVALAWAISADGDPSE